MGVLRVGPCSWEGLCFVDRWVSVLWVDVFVMGRCIMGGWECVVCVDGCVMWEGVSVLCIGMLCVGVFCEDVIICCMRVGVCML